jgi:hypothetical protein
MPREFQGQAELHDYAERNCLEHAWEYTPAFAKRQRLLSPEQYEIVEVRTSRGVSRVMLFSKAIIRAEWEANARYARRWLPSVNAGAPKERPSSGRPSSGPASEERVRDQAGAISGAAGGEHCPSFFSGWSCCSYAGRWTGVS